MKRVGQKEYIKSFLNFYNQGLIDKEIAEKLDTTTRAVQNLRHRRQLPVNREYRILTPDFVKEHFDKGLSDKEIALLSGTHANNVKAFRLARGWGDAGKPFNRNYPVELTDLEAEILVGSLLGDASLKRSGFSVSGKFEHCLAQKEYCCWKHEKLSRISGEYHFASRQSYFDNSKTLSSVYFYLKTNPALENLYQFFYSSGEKQVSKDILKYLTPVSLAVWYMDDGTHKHRKGKGSNVTLCTDSFSQESLNILVNFLQDKYQIITHVDSRNRIYFDAITRQKFLDLIKPYIHPSMWYKYTGENKKEFLLKYNSI